MELRQATVVGLVAALFPVLVLAVAGVQARTPAQSEGQITREVERRLTDGGELGRALRNVDVSVQGSEVTLGGTVPNLWAKQEAIGRALQVGGVVTVASELIIPSADSDETVAQDVMKAIQEYVYYTVFDYIGGSITNGVVTLIGYVTSPPDKKGDIGERVARVRGVQQLENQIQILSPSIEDDRLRRAIAAQVFRDDLFQRFASMPNPPFHIIVNRSVVTLVGVVQSEVDKRVMQNIAQHTQGILRVENHLTTRTGR